MMKLAELRTEEGNVVCERLALATDPVRRAKGLLGRRDLPPGEGILLRPAGSIHTAFMRFPIDVAFLARDGRVLELAHELPPWRMAAKRGSYAVVELPAGEASRRGLRVGDTLIVEEGGAR
jgi:uncharacterized membrane protein (UPF0127 family)